MTNQRDDQTTAAASETSERTPDRRRLRAWVAGVLVALTSLGIAIATVTVWTHNTLFETDRFMEVVEPAISDPAFAAALSERVADEVLVALDLETRVADALDDLDTFVSAALIDAVDPGERLQQILDRIDRPSLAILAPSIAEDLETRIAQRIDDVITSGTFRSTLVVVVEDAHRAAVALIEGDLAQYPNVYVEDGQVRINLLPVIRSVLDDVWSIVAGYLPDVTLPDVVSSRVDEARDQLADSLGAALPDDFGQVTIMSEDDLTQIQTIGDRANRLVVLVVVAAILLLVATIAVAPDRRRTIVHLSIGAIAAVIVTFLAIRAVQAAIVDKVTDPNGLRAAETFLADVISDLRSYALLIIAIAIVVGVAAFLAGRPSLLARFDERYAGAELSDIERWIAGHGDAVRAGGLVLVVVGLLLVGFAWWSVLLAAFLLGAVLLYVGSLESAVSDSVRADEPATPEAAA